MRWGAKIFLRAEPMAKEKMLEAFSVPKNLPILCAVRCVLHAMEEAALQQLSNPKLPDSERQFYSGAMDNAREAVLTIDDLVDKGNRLKGTAN
jgi:phosphoglycerate-specific signal transduction histidine kinase